MTDVSERFFNLYTKFVSESEQDKELNTCNSTMVSISGAYSMISREETLKLSLDERDKVKESMSLVLEKLDKQISFAISIWADNFESEFYNYIQLPEDIIWESFFRRGEDENRLSLAIQQIDVRLWLFASALQSLIVKHRSVSAFFTLADFLRVIREAELNAPKIFFDNFRKELKSARLSSPKYAQGHKNASLTGPPKYSSANVPEGSLQNDESITERSPSILANAQALTYEKSFDIHQEEISTIKATQRQLEAIAALQSMLGQHLEVQSIAVDAIFDEAHLSLNDIGRGLDCLQQASANPEGPFKIGAIFLICLSISLLLFDFIK
ncbi:hypothetical protein DI09_126p60 [Mitosporidium daphniae]|uniref:Uncharacterized protein n=1 Tax=Mitosporidium daphniae TaxID=1485682 RepID=A0A098VVE8_9MICR|nr:uncharacterized protein DI09_126p60 [Mitosporidium daphniae]KGG52907.1 hypothetical protein DI09_126p60 [Mitosporidium daphniae]|eukprot:XP_013239343.1 uncharacterized protein DI09_126p60 [Mitosporidium daphniae]